jgi:hypothetical protein
LGVGVEGGGCAIGAVVHGRRGLAWLVGLMLRIWFQGAAGINSAANGRVGSTRLGLAWLGFGRADFTILWFSFIGLMSDCVKSPTKQVRPAVVHLSAAKTAASARSGRLHNMLGDGLRRGWWRWCSSL